MKISRQALIVFVLALFLGATFFHDLHAGGPQVAPPKFKVMGERYMNSITILVDKSVSDEQIRALLLKFKNAKASGTFAKIGIPPTTPGGALGPYASIQIFIFTDPQWTGAKTLERATNDLAYMKKWNSHIRGYYFLPIGSEEIGTIGFKEDGITYTKKFVEVFGRS